MFEDFIKEQELPVKILTNEITSNKLSHAYIFETNNYEKADELVIQFIKYIECPDSIKKEHNEKECYICSSINSNNFIELKIIDPDSLQIKKEEMIDLQKEFASKVISGNKKVYLIKNAERLNSSSSNAILKFLEEPEENITAILMTSSRYSLLKTILSRCQVISLSKTTKNTSLNEIIYKKYFNKEEYNDEIKEKIESYILNTIRFVNNYEKNIKDSLLFTNQYFHEQFKTREDALIAFEIIKMLYYDVLCGMEHKDYSYFENYKEEIEIINKLNNIDTIAKKLNIVIETIDKIKYNVNLSLLIDKYLMEIGGIYDRSC